MKKYMKPQTVARDIEVESMLCAGSDTFDSSLNKDGKVTESSQVLSKKTSLDLWKLDGE